MPMTYPNTKYVLGMTNTMPNTLPNTIILHNDVVEYFNVPMNLLKT